MCTLRIFNIKIRVEKASKPFRTVFGASGSFEQTPSVVIIHLRFLEVTWDKKKTKKVGKPDNERVSGGLQGVGRNS